MNNSCSTYSPGTVFVQVIVPKPLYGLFTYAVPALLAPNVRQGSRVLVQFGARHYYTGIVHSFVNEPPNEMDIREIADVLDPAAATFHPRPSRSAICAGTPSLAPTNKT